MISQHRRWLAPLAVAIAASCIALPASAYVGPGAGLTLVGALWGLILAVGMSVGFIVLWPFRRLLRRHRGAAPMRGGDDVTRETKSDRGEDSPSR